MDRIDKDDFIKMLKIGKPKVVDYYEYISFFGKYHFRFVHKDYYYETTCYDCRFRMKEEIASLKIDIIELKRD